ncbi:pentraxin-related protein PTX3 [Acanthochromis polyacanthus]|uniref:pentraxin-related protein PTX3 n=1 Tax=Acanthochromis polyacanthus TaxID=80966 RepID=UPI0022343F83|nr:pentraxin-related protein PTX3 [Acanthochromis polyacanthus]
MFQWRLPQALCVLSVCVCLALAYEDDIEVNYADTYYNEITEGETPEPTPSPAPCSSADLTKWDKMFSMLENSQMRENMLLQYADDIIKVEMGSLRSEMLRFVAQYGGSCGAAVETAGRRMTLQLEGRLRDTLDRFKAGDQTSAARNSVGRSNHLEAMLQQLLSTTRTQMSRLAKLETSCFSSPGAGTGTNTKTGFQLPRGGGAGLSEQEVTRRDAALDSVLAVLQEMKVELGEVLRSSRQRHLPAGCEMALLFPMRSRRIYTAVIPDVRLSLSSFTVCMWVKQTTVSNKTVLFSYGNRRNPYEIQLLLSQTSALFTVGGEAHLVEGRDVVKPGQWIHLCGSWSSEQGLASLWADGKKVASTPGVAEGHVLPEEGSLQLGQERNGCCPTSSSSSVAGFEGGFDPKLAFAGKMTGVNMWDKVLSEEKISQLALQEGQGCDQRGSIVAWGVTEMVPHGGAQFII